MDVVMSSQRYFLWKSLPLLLLLPLLCCRVHPIRGKIVMPAWFGDNMVLQSNREYGARSFLNGLAEPFEQIQIETTSSSSSPYSSALYNIRATAEGTWKMQILASERYTIKVTGEDGTTLSAENVTSGDVYFCSGQSNMVFPMKLTLNASVEVATLQHYPNFRFFMTKRGTADMPQFDVPVNNASVCDSNSCNEWLTADEALTSGFIDDFSAVCFMTVRDVARLHTGNMKPVALVQSAWGGTRVEAWMSADAIEKASRRVLPPSSSSSDPVLPPVAHNTPNMKNVLYNAMIAPFNSMSIRAALWYQGEANADQKISPEDSTRGVTQTSYYAAYLSTMIEDWRDRKEMGDFPFFVVSLPPSVSAGTPLDEQMKTGRNEIRLAEFSVAPRKNGTTDISGVPVTTELGGSSAWGFDHPFNKNEISRRLALQVVHAAFGVQGRMIAYDDKGLAPAWSSLWTGPLFDRATTTINDDDENMVVLRFADFSANGLILKNVKGLNHDNTHDDCTLCCDGLPPFEVLFETGRNWTRVSRNNTQVVQSEFAIVLRGFRDRPQAVRYGWTDFQECVLVNNDSLPLAPFVWTSNDGNNGVRHRSHLANRHSHDRDVPSFRPPLGFNTWNFFHCNIDENEVKAIAEIMIDTGLAAAGYEYINIDDCWQVDRLRNGTIVVDPVRFPSGMKVLADFVHSKGLKFGVYTAQRARTCQDRPGSFNFERIDAETYCEWGVDYLKVDGCHGDSHPQLNTSWIRFREGFDECLSTTGRYTTLSVETCGDPKKCGQWIGETADLWRTTGDVQVYWQSVLDNIHQNNKMAPVVNRGQGKRNGHGNFNDPDMLEVGNSGLSSIEQRSMFSLWSIAGAPLLIGTSVRNMSNETLKILTNRDVISVNQDLGKDGNIQGVVVAGNASVQWEVWAKELENGESAAVALVNLDDTMNKTIEADFTLWGWSSTTRASVRDLWNDDDKTKTGRTVEGTVSVVGIQPHETAMLLLTKEDSRSTK